MVDREMLAAMSDLLDQKMDQKLNPIYDRLDRLESDMKYVRVVQLENNIIPRLNTIEACYLDVSRKFAEKAEQDIRIAPFWQGVGTVLHALPPGQTRKQICIAA